MGSDECEEVVPPRVPSTTSPRPGGPPDFAEAVAASPAGPRPPVIEACLTPTIRRFTVSGTSYQHLDTLQNVRKLMLAADATNTVGIRVAVRELDPAAVDEYDVLLGADRLVWETTRPSERLNLNLWGRPNVAGNPILILWVWS